MMITLEQIINEPYNDQDNDPIKKAIKAAFWAMLLADFERCVDWAWITRNTHLESAK